MATPATNDLQQQTDIEQARAKLQGVAEAKEGQKDPRAAEGKIPALTQRGGRIPDNEREIRQGTVPPKKKKFGQKLKEALFSDKIGDGSITEYIFFDIVVKSFKRVVYEGLNTALCMALGMDPKTNRLIETRGNTHTSNASLYRNRQYNGGGYSSRRTPLIEYEWDEATAKDYFSQMLDVVEKYGDMSVMNALSICGLQNQMRTTDRNWGWTKGMMTRADVYAVDSAGERWVIDLGEPRQL